MGNGVSRAQRRSAPAAAEPKAAKGVTGYFITVSVVAVVLLLASLAIAAVLGQRAREARWQEAARQTAELIGNQLALQVATIGQALAEEAKLAVLQQALQAGDRSTLTELAPVLRSAFPLASRLMIVPKGGLAPDPNADPPIGYALLDMVKRASAGGQPAPEVHLPGRPGANVNLVAPVHEGETILGTLVLTFPADRFFQPLNPPLQAWVGLQQRSAGGSVELAELGNRQAAGHRISLRVTGTAWRLEYIGGYRADPLAGMGMPIAGAIIAAAILLILLTALLASARLRQALATDGQAFVRIVQDSLAGQLQAQYAVRLRELQAAVTAALAAARVSQPVSSSLEEGLSIISLRRGKRPPADAKS